MNTDLFYNKVIIDCELYLHTYKWNAATRSNENNSVSFKNTAIKKGVIRHTF